jgi:hypothetical protein
MDSSSKFLSYCDLKVGFLASSIKNLKISYRSIYFYYHGLIFIAFILELKSACLVVMETKFNKNNNNFITRRYLVNFSQDEKKRNADMGCFFKELKLDFVRLDIKKTI